MSAEVAKQSICGPRGHYVFPLFFKLSDFPNIPRFQLRLILVLSSQMCADWNLKWADVEVFHTKTAIYLNGQHLEVFHIRIFIWNCTFSEMLFLKRHFVHRNSDVIFDIFKRSIPIPLHYSKVQNLPFKIIWWTQNNLQIILLGLNQASSTFKWSQFAFRMGMVLP